jgi:hypothetical protein
MTGLMSRALRRVRAPQGASDDGSIVVGWLTKIAITLAVVGLALYDSISIGSTMMSLSDDGSYAARAASETWQQPAPGQKHDLQAAYESAVEAAQEENPLDVIDPKSFRVDPDGTVHLVISREATTLIIQHFGFSKKWADISRAAQGHSVA